MQFQHRLSRAPLHTYCRYWPAGHPAVQLLHVASATALLFTQVCVMNWPAGQLRVQSRHTVSFQGVHAACRYCQALHCEHGWQLYTPVVLQFVPSVTVPLGHADGHRAHCTSAVALQGLAVYWPAPHAPHGLQSVSLNAPHAARLYCWAVHCVQGEQALSAVALHALT